MVIAEEAEDPIPLQRPVATHNEPTLLWLSLFLWERKLHVRGNLRGVGGEAQRREGEPSGPKCGDTCVPLQFCPCLLGVPDGF